MKDYSEKRDYYRMQLDSGIQITDSLGRSFTAICRDLSGTGMQLLVSEALEEGAEVHTLLPTTSDRFPPLETISKVVRCTPSADGYLLGLSIVQVKR
ncbi:PilZ domain-containing protein [Marinobacter sp. SS21]|uniref:PilZ domain-containing protein n=1 Tax=Marinobacter sp. SS21 TaxID=2979460 RepID=UPI002331485E|nr:PilZ domain-containing protein [Marinobacter sp. SS21]MDC0663442.1 PilZ domain-containing protein [Marinobacter sp. SS21]